MLSFLRGSVDFQLFAEWVTFIAKRTYKKYCIIHPSKKPLRMSIEYSEKMITSIEATFLCLSGVSG